MLTDVPNIVARGYTLIWKSGTNKETDEYSLFFEDKVVLNSEMDITDLSFDNDLRSIYLFFIFNNIITLFYFINNYRLFYDF